MSGSTVGTLRVVGRSNRHSIVVPESAGPFLTCRGQTKILGVAYESFFDRQACRCTHRFFS